ncbi:hypothetical protein CERSUDRAFT_94245 [Gelatoporia subvermispora B]|uniref:Uncharacterized protein n=1 Tax=Ceriporiopsis subvermispora (strain B) TaxID=914234 RepID=M2QNS6_CERS8|nr:hypothetical protein CERSUDRAFT_94245 [Gelatoporia subvermispora B]
MLLRAENGAYMGLVMRVKTAESNCAVLERERDTFRSLYEKLQERVNSGNASPNSRVEATLEQDDYPGVQYWHVAEWRQRDKFEDVLLDTGGSRRRGKSRSAQGINVTMRFVESKEGIPVDGQYTVAIRRQARSIWQQWYQEGKVVRTWSMIKATDLAYYVDTMESHFPELKLCAHHWKAEEIAKQTYPNFVKKADTWDAKNKSGLSDNESDVENRIVGESSQKRRGKSVQDRAASKKRRTDRQGDVGDASEQGGRRPHAVQEPTARPDCADSTSSARQEKTAPGQAPPEIDEIEVPVFANIVNEGGRVDDREEVEASGMDDVVQREAAGQVEQDKSDQDQEDDVDRGVSMQDTTGPLQDSAVALATNEIVNPLGLLCDAADADVLRAQRQKVRVENDIVRRGRSAKGRESGVNHAQDAGVDATEDVSASNGGPPAIEKLKYKRPNGSLSAKNLFLVDLGKAGTRVTAEEFERQWAGLGDEGQQKWAEASVQAKVRDRRSNSAPIAGPSQPRRASTTLSRATHHFSPTPPPDTRVEQRTVRADGIIDYSSPSEGGDTPMPGKGKKREQPPRETKKSRKDTPSAGPSSPKGDGGDASGAKDTNMRVD